ncbi:MAG TPA: hypothetical protein DDZ89_20775 [Clostridiales bacterium]|nr:hypothetical protein [Clostridiales bacterium]
MRITLFKKKTIRSISLKHFFNEKKVQPNNITVDDESKKFSNQELLDAIKIAKDDLDLAMEHFHYAMTPEIIDGCIYKIKACMEYYQYLLKLAKKQDLTTSYIPYQLKKSSKKEVAVL